MKLPSITRTYLSNIPTNIKLSEYPLTKMDTKMLEGAQRGLKVFDGVKMEDIAFITKRLETLNLFRGCKCGCSHCLKNALAPKEGRETIIFEDLRNFVFGFRTLSERLGFDVLNGNKYINIVDDSNPIDMKIKGLKRPHNVVEAMKLIYEQLRIPTLFVTSGWNRPSSQSYKYAIDTAKDINKMIKDDKNSVADVQISINPFMDTKNYVDRMARTLFTFLDLFKIDKARIIYRHTKDGQKGFDAQAAKELYENIYKQLQNLSGSKLEGFPELHPDIVTKPNNTNWIEPSGRGRRFFSEERNLKLQNELIQDALDWQNMTPEEQRENLLNNALKCVDIDGSIYTTKPSSATFEATPIELTIPTKIQLNYFNKEKPNPIFSDIEV